MELSEFQHLNRDERSYVLGFIIQARKAVALTIATPKTTHEHELYQKLNALRTRAVLPYKLENLAARLRPTMEKLASVPPIPLQFPATAEPNHYQLTDDARPVLDKEMQKPLMLYIPNRGRLYTTKNDLRALDAILQDAENTILDHPKQTQTDRRALRQTWTGAGLPLIPNPDVPAAYARGSDVQPASMLKAVLHKNWFEINRSRLTREALLDITGTTLYYLAQLKKNAPEELNILHTYAHQKIWDDAILTDTMKDIFVGRTNGEFIRTLLTHALNGSPETGFRVPPVKNRTLRDQRAEAITNLLQDRMLLEERESATAIRSRP